MITTKAWHSNNGQLEDGRDKSAQCSSLALHSPEVRTGNQCGSHTFEKPKPGRYKLKLSPTPCALWPLTRASELYGACSLLLHNCYPYVWILLFVTSKRMNSTWQQLLRSTHSCIWHSWWKVGCDLLWASQGTSWLGRWGVSTYTSHSITHTLGMRPWHQLNNQWKFRHVLGLSNWKIEVGIANWILKFLALFKQNFAVFDIVRESIFFKKDK